MARESFEWKNQAGWMPGGGRSCGRVAVVEGGVTWKGLVGKVLFVKCSGFVWVFFVFFVSLLLLLLSFSVLRVLFVVAISAIDQIFDLLLSSLTSL